MMKIDLPKTGTPAGVSLHATSDGATLSVWSGQREMIAHLDPERVAQAIAILSARNGHLQIIGTVREFSVPVVE
ncbi:hypothetical protein MX652_15840 [Thauera aromatica]|nr:hypothetical protein [Thauera aromatica]MCK2128153.1 hypothetical protein [Thauera aromatica]